LKAGLEPSGAGGALRRYDPFVSARSAEVRIPKALPYEKSVKVARRALSATLNWGKHHLAQETGLFRDVLLHGAM
jgi:hypothetical protein